MNTEKLRKALKKALGKDNFLLISTGGKSKMKPIRVVGKLIPINLKPKVQIVDFVDRVRCPTCKKERR